MVLDTTADVDEIQAVQDRNGDSRPAANADEQQAIKQRLGNQAGVTAFEFTPEDDTEHTLPSNAVLEGVNVLVVALDDNDQNSRVYVGESGAAVVPLKPERNIALGVDNTDAITVKAPTAGDGVAVIYEDG